MSLTLSQTRTALRAARLARDHAIDPVDRDDFRALFQALKKIEADHFARRVPFNPTPAPRISARRAFK